VKVELVRVLAEAIDELAPFVPDVGSASPAGISSSSDRISHQAMRDYWNRPRVRLLQEMTMNSGTLV
jgi:hypothetical protein